ncbi:ATP-binding protein [Acaryochloris marina]|uniref:ATP-binding protein n=1 Tax=Acaryochloris marina TaxID=155978 RepID=UPI0021C3C412|nr:ATP-binding protein [Acaryochloris marina]BDM82806.1 hypothetical protein AM10699_56670 [Acaryochloris marina MBIC10699]
MEFEKAKSYINELSLIKWGKKLGLPGEIAIQAAWEGITIAQAIKDHPLGASTSEGYVSCRVGPDLWKLLSQELGIEVKKKNLRLVFEELDQQGMFATTTSDPTPEQEGTKKTSQQINNTTSITTALGHHPPKVPHFYGRDEDFLQLSTTLAQNRFVALIGAAGIGKSALASIYVQRMNSKPQPDFKKIIWMSLHHGQTVSGLMEFHLKECEFTALIQELSCLFVIDCGPVEFEEDKNFQAIAQQFCVGRHQSTLLILSRNTVRSVQQLARIQRPAATIKLSGLPDKDALRILKEQGIQGESDCKKLIKSYRGNPQLLLLAAERINRFCGGKLVESFMLHKTSFASDYVRRVIQEYRMQELTPTEQRILDILIQSDNDAPRWITFSELMMELSSGGGNASMSELIEVLEKWEGMSLIESDNDQNTGEATFMLPPTTRKVLMRNTLNSLVSFSQPA